MQLHPVIRRKDEITSAIADRERAAAKGREQAGRDPTGQYGGQGGRRKGGRGRGELIKLMMTVSLPPG